MIIAHTCRSPKGFTLTLTTTVTVVTATIIIPIISSATTRFFPGIRLATEGSAHFEERFREVGFGVPCFVGLRFLGVVKGFWPSSSKLVKHLCFLTFCCGEGGP